MKIDADILCKFVLCEICRRYLEKGIKRIGRCPWNRRNERVRVDSKFLKEKLPKEIYEKTMKRIIDYKFNNK